MPRKPDERVIFFVDRSLGGKLVVQALRQAGAEVVVHDDVFDQSTPDLDWLAKTGKQGWIVLTKDSAIRRNPLERETYRAANARVFALTRKDLSGMEMAEIFVRALPSMLAGSKPPRHRSCSVFHARANSCRWTRGSARFHLQRIGRTPHRRSICQNSLP